MLLSKWDTGISLETVLKNHLNIFFINTDILIMLQIQFSIIQDACLMLTNLLLTFLVPPPVFFFELFLSADKHSSCFLVLYPGSWNNHWIALHIVFLPQETVLFISFFCDVMFRRNSKYILPYRILDLWSALLWNMIWHAGNQTF